MNTALTTASKQKNSWRPLSGVTIGKDILELLSSSMYVDPMTIYREYIQNAADAIDEAVDQGLLNLSTRPGQVSITIDTVTRTVRIRDNGIGVRRPNFESQLGTFGGSLKRGRAGRGFRGVGRLSGLGYCQKLTFRTRSTGETDISEMVWDCRRIKKLLNTPDKHWSLEDLLTEVVSVRRIPDEDKETKSFFEVEMSGVIRHRNDVLLNRETIYDYLSEVGPVPFHPDFSFGSKIVESLKDKVALGSLNINVEGKEDPVYRPHRDSVEVNGEVYDRLTDLKIYTLPSVDEGIAAIGWFLNHGYKGTIPDKRIGGVRLRCGNIQVGGRDLVANVFKEQRFNSWAVGEVHILDGRIIPNGRRDYFEQGVHLDNLLNHITPHTREITASCRESSRSRNQLREFSRLETVATEKLTAAMQGLIDKKTRASFIAQSEKAISAMAKCVSVEAFDDSININLNKRIGALQDDLNRARDSHPAVGPLQQMSKAKREAYKKIFGLIYSCSDNQESARKLIQRIVAIID